MRALLGIAHSSAPALLPELSRQGAGGAGTVGALPAILLLVLPPMQDMQEPARHSHSGLLHPVAMPPAQRGEPQARQAGLQLLAGGRALARRLEGRLL